jgi:tRNA-Thr(GGU) m(6)t(6)A37 methyltransferase TsaA
MQVLLDPIGHVQALRSDPEDDFWGGEEACINLEAAYPAQALQGLEGFSHAEIIFLFHKVPPEKVVASARHPRNNQAWPAVGIFAQRGKNRPNRLGSTICRIVRVEATRLYVAELDAIDGTPVLDIKPVMREFLPRGQVSQPDWATELMKRYWLTKHA